MKRSSILIIMIIGCVLSLMGLFSVGSGIIPFQGDLIGTGIIEIVVGAIIMGLASESI